MSAPLEVIGTITPRKEVIAVRVVSPVQIPGELMPTLTINTGGNSTYTWQQAVALATWTIPHNLNRFPSVTVVDTAGNRIQPDIQYLDANIVQVTHSGALAGRAYLN